jgi:hypothetical protein
VANIVAIASTNGIDRRTSRPLDDRRAEMERCFLSQLAARATCVGNWEHDDEIRDPRPPVPALESNSDCQGAHGPASSFVVTPIRHLNNQILHKIRSNRYEYSTTAGPTTATASDAAKEQTARRAIPFERRHPFHPVASRLVPPANIPNRHAGGGRRDAPGCCWLTRQRWDPRKRSCSSPAPSFLRS